MKNIINRIIGRLDLEPIRINQWDFFISNISRHATRVDQRFKFEVPILSNDPGFVFFLDDNVFMIRHNSAWRFGFTSPVYFSGRRLISDSGTYLTGCFRFPWFIELPKILILIVVVAWVFYFLGMLMMSLAVDTDEVLVFVIGLLIFCVGGFWFANVPVSFFARAAAKRVRDLLDQCVQDTQEFR